MINKIQTLLTKRITFYIIVFIIVLVAVLTRYFIIKIPGGDHLQYESAVMEFRAGINPYEYTTISFLLNGVDHGYAYFPTLLYILSFTWHFNEWLRLDTNNIVLWKFPILISELIIAFFLLKHFYERHEKKIATFAILLWLFNPWYVVRYEYTSYDFIQILFLVLALYFLQKKDTLAGIFYALAVSIKLTPMILLPIFLLKTKNPLRFILIGALVFLIISLPFLHTFNDLYFYLHGTILVHGERSIQGRPILSLITYYLQNYSINFYQSVYPDIYVVISLLLAPIVTTYLLLSKRVTNKYTLVAISFALYYLFTPIFSRTHILWGYPFFIIALYNVFSNKKKLFYISSICLYTAVFLYTAFWFKGLKAIPNSSRIIIDDLAIQKRELPVIQKAYGVYYDYRHKFNVLTGKDTK